MPQPTVCVILRAKPCPNQATRRATSGNFSSIARASKGLGIRCEGGPDDMLSVAEPEARPNTKQESTFNYELLQGTLGGNDV